MNKVWMLISLILFLLLSCSRDQVAGKPVGDETTNGIQLALVDLQGNQIPMARVAYMPSWSRSAKDTKYATANEQGVISIDSLSGEAFWFEVIHHNVGIRALLTPGADTLLALKNLGQIYGQAPQGSVVTMYGSDRVTIADSNGSYFLDSLAPGKWIICIETPEGIILLEDSIGVEPAQNTEIQWRESLIADWTTWKHHRTWVLAEFASSADSLLHTVPVALQIANAEDLELHSMRVIDEQNEFIPFHLESLDSSAGKAILWIYPQIQIQNGMNIHVVWNKQGITSAPVPLMDSNSFGVWHFDEQLPYINSAGIGADIKQDTLSEAVQGFIGFGRQFAGDGALFIESPNHEFDAFSVSCWIRYSGESQINYAKVLHMGWPDFPFGTLMIDIDSLTRLPAFQVGLSDSSYVRIVTSENPARDDSIRAGLRWVHVYATWSKQSNEARLYLDGQLQGTAITLGNLLSHLSPSRYDLIIGNQWGLQAGFKGVIDEFRFETRIHSPLWIKYQHWLSQENSIQEY